MNLKKILLGSLLAGGALALSRLAAARVPSSKPASTAPAYADIDAYIEEQSHRLNIPGAALAIVEGDRIVHMRFFGRARPGGAAPDSQTPFFIGSLTKSFTALAVMQLVEAGKIELDAPLQRYLPWFCVAPLKGPAADPQVSAKITVRHLLNQTSGIPMLPGMSNLADCDSRPGTAERQARALSTLVLNHPPGSGFEYSNWNYNLLGLVIEAASGEDYAGYIQRSIFEPLEMRHSYTTKAEARQNGLAVGHTYWFGLPRPVPGLPIPRGSLASGQLISCVEDMAHYLGAQLNAGRWGGRQILSGAGILEMQHGVAEIREMGQSFGFYGMGWISQGSGAARIISHSGIVPDFGGYMALVPGQNKGLILLFNANHAMLKLTFDMMGGRAAQLLAGESPAVPGFTVGLGMMRSLLLIPALQAAGVAGTLRLLARWRNDPSSRPDRVRAWGQHILPALVPDLSLAAFPFFLQSRGLLGFARFFMPDVYWTALIGGGFAGLWAMLRTGLVLRSLPSGGGADDDGDGHHR